MKRVLHLSFAAITFLYTNIFAQGALNLGENVNIFDTTGSGAKGIGGPFKAETLYLGGVFFKRYHKRS